MPLSPTAGYVYVLTNPAMRGLVKIGRTTAADPKTRVRTLNTSAVPYPFEIEFAGKVDDCRRVEKALHIAFDDHRVNPKREFFKIRPDNVIAVLELLSDDATDQVEAEESSTETVTKRRPALRFDDLGLTEGTVLVSTFDPTIKAAVSEHPRKVRLIAPPSEYDDLGSDGEPVRLWPLSRDLSVFTGGTPHVGSQTLYWTLEDDTSLVDLYEKAYPLE